MKIIVCIKHVPANDGPIAINRESDWVHEGDLAFETSEADACALEEALSIKEKMGGEVIALSLGPERALKCLKDALAKGADSVIHVVLEDAYRLSPYMLARAIGAVVKGEFPDLIVTGMQSNDRGNGQLAPNLAQELGCAHATMIASIDVIEGGFTVKRELEGGRAQKLQISTPCVLAVQSGINKPRYASMKGIMAAKKKTVKTVSFSQAVMSDHAGLLSPMHLYVPTESTSAQRIEGGADAIASALSQILRNRKAAG